MKDEKMHNSCATQNATDQIDSSLKIDATGQRPVPLNNFVVRSYSLNFQTSWLESMRLPSSRCIKFSLAIVLVLVLCEVILIHNYLLLAPPPEDDFPSRKYCSVVKISRNGKVSVEKPSDVPMIHPEVFKNLQKRLQYAVREFGPLHFENDSPSLLFDLSTVDLPHCNGFKGNTCDEMLPREKCCGKDGYYSTRTLPLIGQSRHVCCNCSMPLPLQTNQMPKSLHGIFKFHDPYRWEEKKSVAVWHGSNTGYRGNAMFYTNHFRAVARQQGYDGDGDGGGPSIKSTNSINASIWWPTDIKMTPRQKIVDMAMKLNETMPVAMPKHQWGSNDDSNASPAHCRNCSYPPHRRPLLLEASMEKVPWEKMVQHKYIVAVSGNSYASLLKPALLSKSCVLRQDAIATEWYELFMQEWVHYVPVLYDLSDLLEKIQWAMDHDEECKSIGENGRAFALRYFNDSAINEFVHKAISNTLETYRWDDA